MHEDFDFDGEAEMKTLQEVHDMLVLTGYKEEAESVKKAIQTMQEVIDKKGKRWHPTDPVLVSLRKFATQP